MRILFRGAAAVLVLVATLGATGAPKGEGNALANQPDARGVVNIAAFGRLLGYVRHFHPSDEAAAADWEAFAIGGVEQVEAARNPAQLKAVLGRLFAPLAPTLRLATVPIPPLQPATLRPAGTTPSRITGWRYHGWPDPQRPLAYNGRRVIAPADAPGDSVLPLGSEQNGALGGGVWCSMPLTLFLDGGGTVPRSSMHRSYGPRRPRSWVPTADDRSVRLANVILFWNAAQHFEPYLDLARTDWSTRLEPALRAAALAPDAHAFDDTLRRFVAALDDAHVFAWSRTSRDFPATTEWPVVWGFIEHRLVLTRVDTTRAGGAHAGDEVTALQGRPAEAWIGDAEAIACAATAARRDVHAARALNGMLNGDTLTLDLRSPQGVARRVRLTRRTDNRLLPARPDSVCQVAPGVTYIDLSRVTDADLDDALPRIAAGKGVVFDLRGYPNRVGMGAVAHLTDSTLMSPWLCVPLILRPDRGDTTWDCSQWKESPKKPRLRVHAAFLIDARAMSYAESMLAFIEHYRLAELVGEPTGGTNGVPTTVPLPGGYKVNFTGMKVLKNDGSRHHGIGILPTVPVSMTIAGIAAGRDEQLESAIEVVSR